MKISIKDKNYDYSWLCELSLDELNLLKAFMYKVHSVRRQLFCVEKINHQRVKLALTQLEVDLCTQLGSLMSNHSDHIDSIRLITSLNLVTFSVLNQYVGFQVEKKGSSTCVQT